MRSVLKSIFIFSSANQSSPFCRVKRSLATERRRLHHPGLPLRPLDTPGSPRTSPHGNRAGGDELLPQFTPLPHGGARGRYLPGLGAGNVHCADGDENPGSCASLDGENEKVNLSISNQTRIIG